MLRRLIALSAAVVTLLLVSVSSPAAAAGYMFKPGHPMFLGGPNGPGICTGGYAVRGTSGMFVVTAGHCFGFGMPQADQRVVYGTDSRYGTMIRNDYVGDWITHNSFDSALVKLDAGNDAQQIVVDPLSGRSPGSGRVMGYYRNSALSQGFVIGKMGRRTGWTEGRVTSWQQVTYNGAREYLLCSTVPAAPGDSGGPVWRLDGNGVMAIGIVIAGPEDGSGMCFKPIENVLNRFGAWLPVFGASGKAVESVVVSERSGPPVPVNSTPMPVKPL
ncbi:trypsin-like peptidase domain-containing protein [Micromonospora sp. DT231]